MKNPWEERGRPLPRLAGRDFSDEKIAQAMQDRRLLRVNIEIGQNYCPLRCIYCYSNSGELCRGTIPLDMILRVIDEAVALGAESIILTGGGEPLEECTHFRDIVRHIRKKEKVPVVFTCGVPIADHPETAAFLADHGVTVITKLNSTEGNPEPTNELSGRDDTHRKMLKAIETLLKHSYYRDCPPEHPTLGVESVITRLNYNEIVPLWQWIRQRNAFPYIELTKLMGRANWEEYVQHNRVDVESARRLFEEVAELDRREYGYHWMPIPPIMASQCTCYYCGCYVDMFGRIHPCSGVNADGLGDINNPGGLRDAVASPNFDARVRKIVTKLTGKCGACSHSRLKVGCYGCRAHSFWEMDEDDEPFEAYCREDPLCWIQLEGPPA